MQTIEILIIAPCHERCILFFEETATQATTLKPSITALEAHHSCQASAFSESIDTYQHPV